MSIHSQHHLPHHQNPHLKPNLPPHPDSLFNIQYNPLLSPTAENDPSKAFLPSSKSSYLSQGPYRTSTAFNAFTNSSRPPRPPPINASYRDPTSAFHPYTTAADVFGGPPPPPLSHNPPSFDPMNPGRVFEPNGAGGAATALGSQNHGKPGFVLDGFNGHAHPGAGAPFHLGKPPGPPPSAVHNGYPPPVPYMNGGIHVSQTPYGPHLPTNGANAAGPPGLVGHANGTTGVSNPANEEISTIFVVGFPDDMQEREFQNMFTFSSGFEAATLKIPNKEYTAYNGGGRPYASNYGSNDPYNLVTVNQGGVVVDGGRDGTTSSWPAVTPQNQSGDEREPGAPPFGAGPPGAGPQQGMMPPRKQIIGFAKFRTRSDALEARDVLQGRRVDIEKGAVLKAEMAKKNLHTKRGVGPLPISSVPTSAGPNGGANSGTVIGGSSSGGVLPPEPTSAMLGAFPGGMSSAGQPQDMGTRERELSPLGSMVFGVGPALWRDAPAPNRDEEESQRRREREREREVGGLLGGINLMGARGPRERAEEEERERRRKEKETRALRTANPSAFDAFHSVPAQNTSVTTMSRSNSGAALSMLSPTSLESPMLPHTGSYPPGAQQQQEETIVAPVSLWGDMITGNSVYRKSNAVTAATLPSSSSCPSSPPHTNPSVTHSPAVSGTPLPQFSSGRPSRLPSPPADQAGEKQPSGRNSSQPPSSASSVVEGSQGSNEDATRIVRGIKALAVSTSHGSTSPQLPSPASGASSGGRTNLIDQNPPINTLYVGNLPSQMPPGYPPTYLEDSLKDLFSRRPGYRKLCFRQKTNGPMCFVEFEDVSFATKSLNDLYGNSLNGLIKGGGIRLSYSKNPLGVRTPTSAGSGPSLQQQQQMGPGAPPFSPDAFQTRSSFENETTSRPPGLRSPPQNYMMASPPPRFFSPTPSSGAFAALSSMPRSNHAAPFGLPPMTTSNFSPFGMSTPPPAHASIMPEQTNTESTETHFTQHSALSPPANNLEATRAS